MVGIYCHKLFLYCEGICVMKRLLLPAILFCFLVISCQKEQFTVIEDNQESIFIENGQLTRLMQSVAAHDGSFDDILDQASCFSINFPYEILLNGKVHSVNSSEDLEIITMYDSIIPVYPITVTLADHSTRELVHVQQYFNLKDQCDAGVIFNELITCIDLDYPFSIATFFPETNNYGTVVLNSDLETFIEIQDFSPDTRVSINFPITCTWLASGNTVTVTSHQELKNFILNAAANACD